MARIIVVADTPADAAGAVLYQERVAARLLDSPHASGQLMERIAWAIADAEAVEEQVLGTTSG